MCFQQHQGMANPIAYSIDGGTTIAANTLSYQTLQQQQVPPPIDSQQQLVLTQQSQPASMHGCHNLQAPMQALAGLPANAAYQILTQQQQQVQGSVMTQQQQAPPPQQAQPSQQQQQQVPASQQQQQPSAPQQQQQPAIVTLPQTHPDYACGATEGKGSLIDADPPLLCSFNEE